MNDKINIILSTSNEGKIKEFQNYFDLSKYNLIPQSEVGIDSPPENGLSFMENSIIKARYALSFTSYISLADDSGLIVPALNGEPGIYSARYAGEESDSSKNIEKLLLNMNSFKGKDRFAYFCCVIVIILPKLEATPLIVQKFWQGSIAYEPRGTEGFGYDSVFLIDKISKTAAELSMNEKQKLSHRGKALTAVLEELPKFLQLLP